MSNEASKNTDPQDDPVLKGLQSVAELRQRFCVVMNHIDPLKVSDEGIIALAHAVPLLDEAPYANDEFLIPVLTGINDQKAFLSQGANASAELAENVTELLFKEAKTPETRALAHRRLKAIATGFDRCGASKARDYIERPAFPTRVPAVAEVLGMSPEEQRAPQNAALVQRALASLKTTYDILPGPAGIACSLASLLSQFGDAAGALSILEASIPQALSPTGAAEMRLQAWSLSTQSALVDRDAAKLERAKEHASWVASNCSDARLVDQATNAIDRHPVFEALISALAQEGNSVALRLHTRHGINAAKSLGEPEDLAGVLYQLCVLELNSYALEIKEASSGLGSRERLLPLYKEVFERATWLSENIAIDQLREQAQRIADDAGKALKTAG